MNAPDRIRLQHMLDAAVEARSFAHGRTRGDLDTNRMLLRAIVKDIEIIGEAAAKVSSEGQSECPQLPWADLIGMRNRLIHAYFDINLDLVWETIQQDLPFLVAELRQILDTTN